MGAYQILSDVTSRARILEDHSPLMAAMVQYFKKFLGLCEPLVEENRTDSSQSTETTIPLPGHSTSLDDSMRGLPSETGSFPDYQSWEDLFQSGEFGAFEGTDLALSLGNIGLPTSIH